MMSLTGQWPAGTTLMVMSVWLRLGHWDGNPWGLQGSHVKGSPDADFARGACLAVLLISLVCALSYLFWFGYTGPWHTYRSLHCAPIPVQYSLAA